MKIEYLLIHHGHGMNFPSEESMRFYVDDFVGHFPETSLDDLKMYKVEFHELTLK